MKRDDTLIAAIKDMAVKVGSMGFQIRDIVGYKPRHVDGVVRRLIEQGLIFKGKLGHRTVRFFGEESWAMAYSEERRLHERKHSAKLDSMQEVVYPKDKDGNPLYKVTVCPSNFDPIEAQIKNRSRWNSDTAVWGHR